MATPATGPSAAAAPRDITAAEAVAQLRPNDTFVISTSEFVDPAIPIVYVKNKGTYLLFRMPNVSTTLVPEMPLWFKITAFGLRAELRFRGEIYKIFSAGETTYPCIIIKLPAQLQMTPDKMADGLMDIEMPMTWRKTAAMKRGTLRRLTLKGGIFETPEENVATRDKIKIQLTFGDSTTDELAITIERITPNDEGGNFLSNTIEFTFKELSPVQESKIQNGINEARAALEKRQGA